MVVRAASTTVELQHSITALDYSIRLQHSIIAFDYSIDGVGCTGKLPLVTNPSSAERLTVGCRISGQSFLLMTGGFVRRQACLLYTSDAADE